MRIAIYYDTRLGRNDGGPLYYCTILKALGHDVIHLSSENMPDKFGKFDLHMWVDWGEDSLSNILPYKPISMKNLHPSVYITSDTHLGYEYRLRKAKEFTYVFCNQIRAMEDFRRDGVAAEWLPHAVEPKAYPNEPLAIKKYDTCFIGFITGEKRALMLDTYFKAIPCFWYGQRLFEECAEVYRKSRIVFNTAAVDDINMRCFEATATGSFLLTENIPTMDKCFIDGEHIVTYDNMDDAIDKARYYLEHEDEREEIAKSGMEHTLSLHTYKHRVDEIIRRIYGDGKHTS